MHHECRPTRMSSGSDWLHDVAAELVETESRGISSLPHALSSTSSGDLEFAARSSYSMLAETATGLPICVAMPASYATPLPARSGTGSSSPLLIYAEAGRNTQGTPAALPGSPSTAWRRLLQPVTTRRRSRDAGRDHPDGEG